MDLHEGSANLGRDWLEGKLAIAFPAIFNDPLEAFNDSNECQTVAARDGLPFLCGHMLECVDFVAFWEGCSH
jgi:hypothetical protein